MMKVRPIGRPFSISTLASRGKTKRSGSQASKANARRSEAEVKPRDANSHKPLLTILRLGTYLLLDTKQTVVFGDTLRTR